MPTIDAKVGIRGENHRTTKRFGHADETGIGEAHWHVRILLQEPEYWFDVVVQVETRNQGTAAKQRAEPECSARTEKVEGLGQNRFAGGPGWGMAERLRCRPSVV